MSDRLKTGYEMSHPVPGSEILITGLSGYFPESSSVAELQENLFNKVSLVTRDDRRWKFFDTDIPHELGKINKLENFDASFFGIDFNLAHHVDPMSRLLLERTYEAIIDAGMNPAEFRNTRMGVFVGSCFYESEKKLLYEKVHYNEHGLIGCSSSTTACRIAQWLGTTGPAYTVDTACSSCVYAFDHAFKNIRSGACDAALVCGINTCLNPYISMAFSRMGILSPDGKCKSFDASANGYVRAEAAAVCLLQKAKDSRRAYAQIVYVKTNCDGFKDNGITYPAGNIQRRLLKDFYEECHIPSNTVEYKEAHGTGTSVGDLEELNAIDDVFCKDRIEPLLIGTVKSNIGHAEGASGLCSAVKMCIAYHSGYIAPNINYSTPRKEIPALAEGRLKVVTEKQAWNRGLASFSGFGFGGANSHVLLRNYSKKKINNGIPIDNLPRLVCVSGCTKSAVELILNTLREKSLDAEEIRLWHAIHENRIDGHKFRGFAVLKSTPAGTVTLAHNVMKDRNNPRSICLVYSSVCSQLTNVKKLMDVPEFAAAIDKCNVALKAKNINLLDIITGNSAISSNYIHLCVSTLALQVGLTDVIRSIGVKPDTILGYGIGEVGCAYANGIITAEEAMEKAYFRGMDLMRAPAGNKNKKENYSLTAKEIILLIPTNAIIIQVTPEHSLKNTLKSNGNLENEIEVILIKENTENAELDLFIGLGRLYEAGLNLKIEKLYPYVPFPVSQSTPMLSHLVAWDHRENWYTYRFFDDHPKFTAVERIVTVSMDNPDSDYLRGHCVGGRLLYPGSGYLLHVWETLARMHGRDYTDFSVVFENIQYIRATTIPKKGELHFNITIQPVSGEFEVTENKVSVVTGIIYPKKNNDKKLDNVPSPDHYKNPEIIKQSEKDFYKEIKLRGYDYGGMFKGVLDCDLDGSYGRVAWNNNWIVYIDYVLQVVAFSTDTRNLYVPTACKKLSIDTDLHYKTLAKTTALFNQPFIEVFVDKDSQVTRSGGLELRGFNATMISKKADLIVPIYEKYDFIPNYGKDILVFEEVIRCYIDIIVENTQVHKFKAIEIIDEEYKSKINQPILNYVEKDLEFIAQVWADLNIIITKKNSQNKIIDIPLHITELIKLPTDKSAVLLVGVNLSQKEQIVKDSDSCLRDGGFIISREEDASSITKLNDKFEIIAIHTAGDKILALFKKKIKVEKKVFIKIEAFDQSFLWIARLKEAIKQNNKIVLYAYDDLSGIMGLVNCLRKEPGGDIIQCLFVPDQNKPSFDPEFYKSQLDKDLAFNIYKDGQWGTYRHIVIKNLDLLKLSPHAYVDIETIGDLSSIKWLEGGLKESKQDKKDNFVFVHVYCSALNFRDVVTATGRVSVDAVARGRLAQARVQGFEFAGKLANGLRVAGITEQSISNVLLCNKNLMMLIPDEWTFEEAATVVVAYSTVYLAFDVLGKMKPGESVLIHAGSGAVGQAAINVAIHRGCEVFTTVGTLEKKEFIKKLYPQLKDNHIGNSRDTSFEQMIMKQTKGRGVDLVLNSLSDNKLLASVRCLGRQGRFLEIGKYDIFKNTPVEMSIHKNEISFHGVMLDYIFENVNDGRNLIEFVTKGILKGEVRPITHCTFEKQDVEAAYRYIANSKHIGKVLIKIREEDEKFVKPKTLLIDAHRRYTCHRDNVYILVGGLGGFGLELADWLVLRGARKLVLVSSKGISTGYQSRRVRIWTSYGADIRVLTDDVATECGCKKILESAAAMGHVEAIFNLAAILHDALFPNQSPEWFRNSLKPKALVTLHLDKLSRNMCPGLRDFVVFSSLSSGRGNSGQSNYGLSNSVMERICEKRRKDGLPGLAIQWGAIAEVGMLADLENETDMGGIMTQRITSCLRALDILVMQENAILSTYVLAPKKVTENNKKTAVETVAQIIGVKNLKTVSYQISLADLGMDSMMALEVKQTLETDFDIILSAQDLRTITFAKLISLSPQQQGSDSIATSTFGQVKAKVKDDWVFDLRYFLRNFGEEENALKPFIIMSTQLFTNTENVDNNCISGKTMFMIPGLEGRASSLEPLCRQLHIEACVLQLSFDNTTYDLQDMTDRLYKVIKPLKKHTSSFNLLGYSYGTIPMLALAAKLEIEGYMGTVFCIDGSPTWLRSLLQNKLGIIDNVELQDNVIKYILEATLPDDSLVKNVIEKTTELSNFGDKIDYIIKHSPVYLKYSKQFVKRIYYECNNRLQTVKDFNIDIIKKIKSPIVLLRPEYGVIHEFPENYELDKFTEGDVKVHFLKGNHVTILEDPNCAAIIEKYINVK